MADTLQKAGKAEADVRVERSLYQRAVGYSYDAVKIFCDKNGKVTRVPYPEHVPPDFTAQIFWLKNRDPAHWRDAWQMEQVLGRYIISDRPMTEEGSVDLCQFEQRFRGQTSDIEGSGRSCRRLQRFARSANRQRTPSQRIRFRSVPRV